MSAPVPQAASSTALAQIVGTGSVRQGLERVEENVRDVIDVCRQRGFVRSFGGDREFYGLPAWQMLGATYGLLPFVEWSRQVESGWEARAVVRTVEGADVGAAEAMCTRDEPNRRRSSEHDLRAMAQTRAMRNALRAVLGSALVLAGFDFADPDAPATRDQQKALWALADQHGWTHDEAHERAGVVSLLNLSREQASELIDSWSAVPEDDDISPAAQTGTAAGEVEVGYPSRPPASSAIPAPQTEGPATAGEGAVQPVGAGGGEVMGEGPPAAGPIDGPWARYNAALLELAKPELAPALLRRAIKAAGLEYPPRPDWPAELLTSCAAILEGVAAKRGAS